MRITIDKSYVGKEVFAIPLGNNRSRMKEVQDIHRFTVISMGKKYVELKQEGWEVSYKYDPYTGATQDEIKRGHGGNAGYMFFASLDDIYNYNKREKQKDFVRRHLRYPSDFDKLSEQTLQQIISELMEYKNEQ